MNELYRVAADGKPTGYGPYGAVSTARNVASNVYGGWWMGRNSATITRSLYVHETSSYVDKAVTYTIQKLTPVLKMDPPGVFQLALEWVNL
jgi:hypothetical protein